MKKYLLTFLLSCLCVLVVSCASNLTSDYPSLENKPAITKLSPKQVDEKIKNKESFTVIYGFPTCPWCQQLIPAASKLAKNNSYKELYYCDIKDMRDNDESKDKCYYEALVPLCKEAGAFDTEKNRVNAPTTLAFKDGQIVGFNIDTVKGHVMDDTNTLPALTEEQRKELNSILNNLFNLTK